jgi:hypothetical protein
MLLHAPGVTRNSLLFCFNIFYSTQSVRQKNQNRPIKNTVMKREPILCIVLMSSLTSGCVWFCFCSVANWRLSRFKATCQRSENERWARGLWLPVYHAHSNRFLMLRKDDTPGHSLMWHSPITALTSALGSVNLHSTLLRHPTADTKRMADELTQWHFRLVFARWQLPVSAAYSAIADTTRLHVVPRADWPMFIHDVLTIPNHVRGHWFAVQAP